MRILLVAASLMEVKLIAEELNFVKEKNNFLKSYQLNGNKIDILISGIGMTFTTFHLTNTLQHSTYDLVINIGIAGSFSRDLKIGQVVNVISEEFADLGIEDRNRFLTLFDSGFIKPDEFPFENGIIRNNDHTFGLDLPKVRGLTTNKSHGRESSINYLFTKFNAHTESMEGAAVFYVCKWMGIPFIQLRSISNFIEARDSSKWDIPLALDGLKLTVLKVLLNINVPVA